MVCHRIVTIASVLILFGNPTGQTEAARLKPDQVDIGVVRVGAIVEANARIYWERSEAADVEPAAETPFFATLKGFDTRDSRGRPQITEINLSIDTSEVGEFNDVVHVTFGSQSVDIPLSVQVREREPGLREVLIADTPFDSSSTMHAATFERWRQIAASAPVAANYLRVPLDGPVFGDIDLNQFDVILLAENGILRLSTDDTDRLEQFIANGGRAVLTAIGFHRRTVSIVNRFSVQHGLAMFETDVGRGSGDAIYVRRDHIVEHPLTTGLSTLTFDQHTPILVTDASRASVLVAVPDGSGSGLLARSRVGSGELILFTNYLWWTWIDDPQTDNAKLLENLLTAPISPN